MLLPRRLIISLVLELPLLHLPLLLELLVLDLSLLQLPLDGLPGSSMDRRACCSADKQSAERYCTAQNRGAEAYLGSHSVSVTGTPTGCAERLAPAVLLISG